MQLPRFTYANVMSTIAVFIALGGTSFAAVKLSKGSVGERELKTGAVTSAKLKDGTITPADLAAGTALSGPRGPRGAEGPQGERGPSDTLVNRNSGTLLSTKGGTPTTVNTLKVPAGQWLFVGTASLIYGGPYSDWFRCWFTFGTEDGASSSITRLGAEANGALAGGLALQEAKVITGPTDVKLRCGHDGDVSATDGRAEYSQLTAIRVGQIQAQ